MNKLIAITALVLTAFGCNTSGSDNSSTKDFGNPNPAAPQQVTAYVPQGTSTTGLLALALPIYAQQLAIHTNCNLQLNSVVVQFEAGIGALARGSDGSTWYTPSGLHHTFTAIQLTTSNFGLPSFCTYSVAPADQLVLPALATGAGN